MGRTLASLALGSVVAACTLTTDLDELTAGGSTSPTPLDAEGDVNPGDANTPTDGGAGDVVAADAVGDRDEGDATTTNPCTSGVISTSEKTATAAALEGSGVSWSSPASALAQDGLAATSTLDANKDESSFLRLTGFGLGLPADATVKGLTLRIRHRSAAGEARDREIRLWNGSSLFGSDKKESDSWPSTFGDRTYGSATDTWGASLTPATLDAAGFGVAIKARLGDSVTAEAAIDAVGITVHYCR